MAKRLFILWGFLIITAFSAANGLLSAEATSPDTDTSAPADTAALPRPHLGYGVHVAPYTSASNSFVDTLNMDWVKVYEPFQVQQFSPTKKVLFRMDYGWPNNWDEFRSEIRRRTIEVVNMGVTAIEVHNEPNLRLEWPRGPNALEYVQTLRIAYTEIKSVAPHIIVVSGGLAPTITTGDGAAISDIDFARTMFANGAGDYFDVFGYHPYGYNAPPEQEPSTDRLNFRRMELVRALMAEYGLADKPVWLTEFGWLRNPAEDGVPCSVADPNFRDFAWMQLDSHTQADYIVRAFDFADRYWEWAGPMFLWNLNWSMLPNETLSICNHMRWFSLLNMKGEPTQAFYRVAAMPRRPARPVPQMVLAADSMTVEVGLNCPTLARVGQFEIQNAGYPGEFTVSIEPAISLLGPQIEVTPPIAKVGDLITVFANTDGLSTGRYIIYINALTEIAGRRISQNLQGYVIVSDSYAACLD